MSKKYSKTPISETYKIAKETIDSGTLEFYMRTKSQEEYNPQNITFASEKHRIPYILRDMAVLCTDIPVGYFISDIARRMTYKNPEVNSYDISDEELEYVTKFIRYGMKNYKKARYIDLNTLI